MMSQEDNFEKKACGCCRGPAAPDGVNRAGLSAIGYRAGIYASFRQAMIESIGSKFEDGDGKRLPLLKGWRARENDYGIAFIEMWAYLADILTFYQERIANESFLRTAVHPESLHRLAALLDYRPAPGVAATAYLAFFAEPGKEAKIPSGLRVQSIPGEGEKPQKFETAESMTARSDLNSVRVCPRPEATNPFIVDGKGCTKGRIDPGEAQALAKELRPGDRFAVFFKSGQGDVEEKVVRSLHEEDTFKVLEWSPEIQSMGRDLNNSSTFKFTRKFRLFGHNAPDKYLQSYSEGGIVKWNEIKEGAIEPADSTLIDYAFDMSSGSAHPLDAVYEGLKVGTWILIHVKGEATGVSLNIARETKALYRLFDPDNKKYFYTTKSDERDENIKNNKYKYEKIIGYTFFEDRSYTKPLFTYSDKDEIAGYIYKKEEIGTKPLFWLWNSRNYNFVYTIDAHERETILNDNKAVLEEVVGYGKNSYDKMIAGYVYPSIDNAIRTRIRKTRQIAVTKGPLSATVTEITVEDALPAIESIRSVEIYELDREILFSSFKYPEMIKKDSDTVYISGSAPLGLGSGRTVILDDELCDPQVVVVSAVSNELGHTAVRVNEPLKRSLKSSSAVLFGNVARATHGESVKAEILGDGDASASYQSFAISKRPVTYVPEPGASQGAESTLNVKVDGIEWNEERDLFGHEPKERIYTASVDADGQTVVRFGDGINGSRLPTGRRNVIASYRQGLGRAGAVRAKTLTSLLDRPAGLKSVTNPGVAQGGADMESQDEVRMNAPNTVRTFDRIVSLRDFEDACREYRGWKVARARAQLEWSGTDSVVRLIVAGADGKVLDGPSKMLLWDYLSARRDTNIGLRLEGYREMRLQITAEIRVIPGRDKEAVQKAAQRALMEGFSFERRDLGEAVHPAGVYRVLHEVEGVEAARVTHLGFQDGMAAALAILLPGPWLPSTVAAAQGVFQMHLEVASNEIAFVDKTGKDVVVNIWRDST